MLCILTALILPASFNAELIFPKKFVIVIEHKLSDEKVLNIISGNSSSSNTEKETLLKKILFQKMTSANSLTNLKIIEEPFRTDCDFLLQLSLIQYEPYDEDKLIRTLEAYTIDVSQRRDGKIHYNYYYSPVEVFNKITGSFMRVEVKISYNGENIFGDIFKSDKKDERGYYSCQNYQKDMTYFASSGEIQNYVSSLNVSAEKGIEKIQLKDVINTVLSYCPLEKPNPYYFTRDDNNSLRDIEEQMYEELSSEIITSTLNKVKLKMEEERNLESKQDFADHQETLNYPALQTNEPTPAGSNYKESQATENISINSKTIFESAAFESPIIGFSCKDTLIYETVDGSISSAVMILSIKANSPAEYSGFRRNLIIKDTNCETLKGRLLKFRGGSLLLYVTDQNGNSKAVSLNVPYEINQGGL